MVTFDGIYPPTIRSKRDNYSKASDLTKLHFHEFESKCQSCSSYLMKGCRYRCSCCCCCCYSCNCNYRYEFLLLVDNSKQPYEGDLTFTSTTSATTATTTMETDDSYKNKIIMNQSSESAASTSNIMRPILLGITTNTTSTSSSTMLDACGKNSRIYLVNESVNLANGEQQMKGINHHHYCNSDSGDDNAKYMTGYPVISSSLQPSESSSPGPVSGNQITPTNRRSTISRSSTNNNNNSSSSILKRYLWLLEMCIVLMLSVCLAQAGFWTFYFPNFLKASGYKELTNMIESVEKQINSTMDAHADALYFWRKLQNADAAFIEVNNDDDDDEDYYPEESVCEQVFPLFLNKAIKYADIDYKYFIKPLILYREHLLTKRDFWFPDGPKTDSILPRQYEQDLYKKDLELKIESFDELANDRKLRQMREEMIIIWRNVKRNLDSSLLCLYLRYSYRHVASDINQFALDMNLQSLHQAMAMLDSAYKRISVFKDQERAAMEKIEENIERQQNLVMID